MVKRYLAWYLLEKVELNRIHGESFCRTKPDTDLYILNCTNVMVNCMIICDTRIHHPAQFHDTQIENQYQRRSSTHHSIKYIQ